MKSILTLIHLGKAVRLNPRILNNVDILSNNKKKTQNKPQTNKKNQNHTKKKEKKSSQKHSIGLTWNINVDALWLKEHKRRIQQEDSRRNVLHVE